MTRLALAFALGVLLVEYRWRRRIHRALRVPFVEGGDEVTATVSTPSGTYTIRGRLIEDDDGIQPPDPWPSSMASSTVRCTCMPNLGYVGIATCPVHNAQVSYTGGVGQ